VHAYVHIVIMRYVASQVWREQNTEINEVYIYLRNEYVSIIGDKNKLEKIKGQTR